MCLAREVFLAEAMSKKKNARVARDRRRGRAVSGARDAIKSRARLRALLRSSSTTSPVPLYLAFATAFRPARGFTFERLHHARPASRRRTPTNSRAHRCHRRHFHRIYTRRTPRVEMSDETSRLKPGQPITCIRHWGWPMAAFSRESSLVSA